ncbi:MAG TPA: phosphoribosylformylglycinamidine synthase subunit PurQ [Myxococcota bacterium]
MSVAVVTFPGSNCDRDVVRAVGVELAAAVAPAWHKDAALPDGTSAVVLPGGFSYGDYLRCGAMAALSPVMAAVKRFADGGGPVLGICNGFQVLCEARMLPGALLRNADGLFHCQDVELEVTAGGKGVLLGYDRKQRIALPIAHGEGNYVADEATLDELERDDRVAFRYLGQNPNGSRRNIAGVVGGRKRNIVGLMPHPERRASALLGGDVGLGLFRGLLA